MQKRSLALSLIAAIGLAAGSLVPAHGATIIVDTDSGTLGGFELVNVGNGLFELNLAPPQQFLQIINGNFVNFPGGVKADFGDFVSFSVTGGLDRVFDLVSDEFGKLIVSPDFNPTNPQALLGYELTSAEAGDPQNPDGLLLAGVVPTVPSPLVDINGDTYDFSRITSIHFALTGTNYTGASSMFGVMTTAGASVIGTAVFSQAAVPEPTSMALLGIGLGGLIVFRRRLARRATV